MTRGRLLNRKRVPLPVNRPPLRGHRTLHHVPGDVVLPNNFPVPDPGSRLQRFLTGSVVVRRVVVLDRFRVFRVSPLRWGKPPGPTRTSNGDDERKRTRPVHWTGDSHHPGGVLGEVVRQGHLRVVCPVRVVSHRVTGLFCSEV